jgi:predicted chitinase
LLLQKTIDSLRKTFYSPFKSDAFVSQYFKNTEKCTCANRNGNGNEASGDGFTYRVVEFSKTLRNNYLKLSKDTRIL